MAKTPAETLIAEVTASVKKDVLESLKPIIANIAMAAEELEKALAAGVAGERTAKPMAKAAQKGAKPKAKKGAVAKRMKSGELEKHMADVLAASAKPMTSTHVRDALLKIPAFNNRKPGTLYTQVIQKIKKLKNVSKTGKNLYSIKK